MPIIEIHRSESELVALEVKWPKRSHPSITAAPTVVSFGSASDCDIVLSSPTVKPCHCVLEPRSNHLYLEAFAPGVRVLERQVPVSTPLRIDHQHFTIAEFRVRVAYDDEYSAVPKRPIGDYRGLLGFLRALRRPTPTGKRALLERSLHLPNPAARVGRPVAGPHPRGGSSRVREIMVRLDDEYAALLIDEAARLAIPVELLVSSLLDLESGRLRSAVRHRVEPPEGRAAFLGYLTDGLSKSLKAASEASGLSSEDIARYRVCTRLNRRRYDAALRIDREVAGPE